MVINDNQIAALIEDRYCERGHTYFMDGMVELTNISPTRVRARCAGTRLYQTTLELKAGKLVGQCTCPAYSDFGPCKHMAAIAYAVKAHNKTGYTPSEDYEHLKEDHERLETCLIKKTKSELVGLVMQIIDDDPDLKWMLEEEMDS